jgi:hypothetical protein
MKTTKQKPKPLNPEIAERMLKSLDRLWENYGGITDEDRLRIRDRILQRVKLYGRS